MTVYIVREMRGIITIILDVFLKYEDAEKFMREVQNDADTFGESMVLYITTHEVRE